MHFTGTVYRNPYWPTWPLLEITQGCTHNRCKFCTMYKEVPFRMSPMEWIEEDLQELAKMDPEARTLLCAAVPRIYHESILGGDCRKPVSAVYNLIFDRLLRL